ncbi:MAG: hypothetical protein KF699_07290 [Phycisphaeraceae bacterium]|nr:hypothetical protein [Phycisphaeraceae bacterium]
MPRPLVLLMVLALGILTAIGLPAAASLLPQQTRPRSLLIVGGRSGWTVNGSVLVSEARGALRTDLLLDPGPYSVSERESMVRSWQGEGAVSRRPAPFWVRDLALRRAGPSFSGWQAHVSAFGWPLPVSYWMWDWQTESIRGGVVPGSAQAGRKPDGVPANALPWRIYWPGLALNSALHCAVLLGAWGLVAWTIRMGRVRRGQCAACGYPRTGLNADVPCPECGNKPLSEATAQRAVPIARVVAPALLILLLAALGLASAWTSAVLLGLRGIDRGTPPTFTAMMSLPYENTLAFRPPERGFGWSVRESVRLIPVLADDGTIRYADPARWDTGLTLPRVDSPPDNRPTDIASDDSIADYRFGLPFAALSATVVRGPGRPALVRDGLVIRPGTAPFERGPQLTAATRTIAAPMRVLPGGMAANTAIHAAAWFLVFLAVGRVLRCFRPPTVANPDGAR